MSQGYATDISLVAAADLTTKQFYFVYIDSNGKAALVAGAGVKAIGVLQNKPDAGQVATVRIFGKTKVVQSASLTVGAAIAADSAGKAKAASAVTADASGSSATAASTGSYAIGILAENGGADAAVGSMFLLHMGAVPATAA